MSHLMINVPDALLKRIQSHASHHAMSVGDWVLEALESYLDEEDKEPTTEDLVQMIEQSQQDLRDGKLMPLEAVLAQIRQELARDAD